MSGAIFTASELKADIDRSCDVCIVGSGAGGAVLAARLVREGLSVVVLEEGGHFGLSDFDGDESKALSQMYQQRGLFSTGDLAMTIMQGRSVGGGTTVNWTTCYRTPDRILDHWARVHGVEGLDPATLAPHFDAVEDRLNIQEWPEEAANANNRVLFEGCRALGWEVKPMRRNVAGCANTGYCGLGCPVGAKQAMGLTYLPDAIEGGMTLYANTRVDHLELSGSKVVAIHGQVLDPDLDRPSGTRVVVRPRVAVCSAGAIGTPALLLRSGLDFNGRVGKRTFMHPVIGFPAIYDHEINGFYGAPQAAGSHEFIDRGPDRMGFFMETPPMQPMLISTANTRFGEELRSFMEQLPHMGTVLALILDGLLPDDEGGTVTLRPDGRVRVDYPFGPAHVEAFRAAALAIARVSLAAGAREVHSIHSSPIVVRSEADLVQLEEAPYGAHEHPIFTAHQMGGCTMGPNREKAVVNNRLAHHHVPNLFVVDGSVLPTALGVNPSETIYGIAHLAADYVAAAL